MLIRQRKPHEYLMPRGVFISGYKYDYISVSVGAFDPLIFIMWLFGKKCARLWIGTDALKTKMFFHYRIRAKLCSLFCDNLTVADWLTEELRDQGIKSKTFIFLSDEHYIKRLYPNGIQKTSNIFTILMYRPSGKIRNIDLDWRYGVDIARKLAEKNQGWLFVFSDGSTPRQYLYDNADVLLRPVRYDGNAIMVQEAKQLGIPVIWSYENGYYEEPNIEEIERRLREIEAEKNARKTEFSVRAWKPDGEQCAQRPDCAYIHPGV